MFRLASHLCFVWLLMASAVHAQSPSKETSAQTAKEARKAYAKGEALYKAGHYEAAQLQFETAYASAPNPVVLLSIAKTQEKRGLLQDTVETLQRYLNERENAPDRAAIEERIRKIQARPGILVLESEPSGARIIVDSRPHTKVTPTELQLTPGSHRIEIQAEGYASVTKQVQAGFAERKRLSVALRKITKPSSSQVSAVEGSSEDIEALTTATWAAVGIAGGSALLGTILGILTLSKQSDFNDNPTEGNADRGENYALAADVAFGVAIASGITALVLYLTLEDAKKAERKRQANSQASLAIIPVATATRAGVVAQLRF